ncbi:MAG: hypothetical protein ACE5JD_17855, partial [Candidatus Methylomirabilia bacterium]
MPQHDLNQAIVELLRQAQQQAASRDPVAPLPPPTGSSTLDILAATFADVQSGLGGKPPQALDRLEAAEAKERLQRYRLGLQRQQLELGRERLGAERARVTLGIAERLEGLRRARQERGEALRENLAQLRQFIKQGASREVLRAQVFRNPDVVEALGGPMGAVRFLAQRADEQDLALSGQEKFARGQVPNEPELQALRRTGMDADQMARRMAEAGEQARTLKARRTEAELQVLLDAGLISVPEAERRAASAGMSAEQIRNLGRPREFDPGKIQFGRPPGAPPGGPQRFFFPGGGRDPLTGVPLTGAQFAQRAREVDVNLGPGAGIVRLNPEQARLHAQDIRKMRTGAFDTITLTDEQGGKHIVGIRRDPQTGTVSVTNVISPGAPPGADMLARSKRIKQLTTLIASTSSYIQDRIRAYTGGVPGLADQLMAAWGQMFAGEVTAENLQKAIGQFAATAELKRLPPKVREEIVRASEEVARIRNELATILGGRPIPVELFAPGP